MKPVLFWTLTLAALAGLGFFLFTISDIRDSGAGSGGVKWVQVSAVEVGGTVPDFKARDHRLNELQLSTIKGVKVVNFWAPWCAPCLEEIPSMVALAAEKVGKVEIIAISSDPNLAEYQRALDLFPGLRESPIRLVFDPDKRAMRAYGVTGFPESFVVGADGRLLKKVVGPLDWQKLPADFWGPKGL